MTQQISFETYSRDSAQNYERYFVPAIGAPLAADLVALAELQPGERVLDIACGTGAVTKLAAERVGSEGTVTGLDLNPGMLAVARATSPGRIEWCEANAEEMPLPDEAFDAVLCQLGLQFMGDRAGALREMHRVLVRGGRLFVSVPGPTPPVLAVLESGLARHVGPQAAGFVQAVFSLHEPEELRTLVEDAGFTSAEVSRRVKTLLLPPTEEFLWHYVHSTPLAAAVLELSDDQRAELASEVVGGCEPFVENGVLVLRIPLTIVVAHT
jgi:ubiquinone/menaquinone biosynthesis C-methylase UbiE